MTYFQTNEVRSYVHKIKRFSLDPESRKLQNSIRLLYDRTKYKILVELNIECAVN